MKTEVEYVVIARHLSGLQTPLIGVETIGAAKDLIAQNKIKDIELKQAHIWTYSILKRTTTVTDEVIE